MLALDANVERLLDFEHALLRFPARREAPQTQRVWPTGKLAAQARLTVVKLENAAGVEIEPIRVRHSTGTRNGLQFSVESGTRETGEGNATVSTGLADPPQLMVHFVYVD
ncbi:MAG TPA: hypothetical protein VKP30_17040 [Polyangiaceae bacterium]|nr:hypothetical protein [Polyangiaceae bacterium]